MTVLAVTGVYQSWRGLGSWQALTDTAYGRILLAKLAAVTLLLAAAAVSRTWTTRLATPAHAAPEDATTDTAAPEEARELTTAGIRTHTTAHPPNRPDKRTTPTPNRPTPDRRRRRSEGAAAPNTGLRRSVLAETLIGVLVLVITTVLTTTVPGRAEAEAADTPPTVTSGLPGASVARVPFAVGSARGTVQVTLSPARTGDNAVEAVVYAADGGFASVPELRIAFTLPEKNNSAPWTPPPSPTEAATGPPTPSPSPSPAPGR
ncbi:hypothetical protein GCM10020256_39470 [Streptomyces thermocoprophilus]